MLNIVIPMAGAGSRFAKAGYTHPKPLIPVSGVPMIRLVIENMRPARQHRFIFICQQAHIEAYCLEEKLTRWGGDNAVVLGIDGVTEGAACTVLTSKASIDNDDPMMIVNSDQWCDVDINDYLEKMEAERLDGIIMTMKASDPKWSFVGLGESGRVISVVEKQAISDEATVGIYNFRRGADFVRAGEAMIAAGERVNNEFYVAPVYNRLIGEGQQVGIFNIGAEAAGMYGLGIPADLELFKSLPALEKALAPCL